MIKFILNIIYKSKYLKSKKLGKKLRVNLFLEDIFINAF